MVTIFWILTPCIEADTYLHFGVNCCLRLENIPTDLLFEISKGKGKGVPLKAWTGPEAFRWLRLPNFKTVGT